MCDLEPSSRSLALLNGRRDMPEVRSAVRNASHRPFARGLVGLVFRRFAIGDHPAQRYSRQERSAFPSLRAWAFSITWGAMRFARCARPSAEKESKSSGSPPTVG